MYFCCMNSCRINMSCNSVFFGHIIQTPPLLVPLFDKVFHEIVRAPSVSQLVAHLFSLSWCDVMLVSSLIDVSRNKVHFLVTVQIINKTDITAQQFLRKQGHSATATNFHQTTNKIDTESPESTWSFQKWKR